MNVARPLIDIGYKVGILTVDSRTEKRKNGYTVWNCRCDCGNTCLAAVPQLRAGYKRSCGCLSRPPLKDYIGKRFGRLTVTEYAGKTEGMHRWKCVCDCGNETIVGQTLLQSGKTRSCGCPVMEDFSEKMGFVDGTLVKKIEARINRPPIVTNTSGYNGVYLNKRTGKWTAQITFKGKTYYLGSYNDIQAAVNARKRGEEMYDDFLDWYYSNDGEWGNDREGQLSKFVHNKNLRISGALN